MIEKTYLFSVLSLYLPPPLNIQYSTTCHNRLHQNFAIIYDIIANNIGSHTNSETLMADIYRAVLGGEC